MSDKFIVSSFRFLVLSPLRSESVPSGRVSGF